MTVASPNDVGGLLAAVEIDSDRPPAADVVQPISVLLSRHVDTFEIMPLRWFPRGEPGRIRRRDIEAGFRPRPASSRDGTRLSLNAVPAQQMGYHDAAHSFRARRTAASRVDGHSIGGKE